MSTTDEQKNARLTTVSVPDPGTGQSYHRRYPYLHLASMTKALYGASCSGTVSVCATRT